MPKKGQGTDFFNKRVRGGSLGAHGGSLGAHCGMGMKGVRGAARKLRGKGWWDDLKGGVSRAWNTLKDPLVDIGKNAFNKIKDDKLISKTLGAVHPLLGQAASLGGVGVRRRYRR